MIFLQTKQIYMAGTAAYTADTSLDTNGENFLSGTISCWFRFCKL